jgi:hypothetical protein
MGLIDPNTGREMGGTRSLNDQQLLRAFAQLDQRINYCGSNVMQIGLLVEYLLSKVIIAKDADGKPLIELDLDGEFQEFAREKAALIDAEVAQIRETLSARQSVNLDDKSAE